MLLDNAAIGLFQLVISITFAVAALYLAFAVLKNILRDFDGEKELSMGKKIGKKMSAVW